jgi:molybdopterin-guanine dinucleotide biosynthesis protein B
MARLFGVTGYSGAGKTTLLVSILPLLVGRGLTVSTIKQANPGFDIDVPGKDSYRHRDAGAGEVMVVSARRWALMHEYRDAPEAGMDELLSRLAPVDLVLIEGFRAWPHPKLEVHRPALGRPLLCLSDPGIVAVASDGPPASLPLPLPWFDLNDAEAVVDFILAQTGLEEGG